MGGDGDDCLNSDAGNDILDGGAGNDSLFGGNGDDVYLFGIGSGHDTIHESETRADRRNVVRLGAGIGVDDIELLEANYNSSSKHMDLVIRIKSTGETLTVSRGLSNSSNDQQNSSDAYKVETISAGGMELVSGQMEQMIQAMASFGVPSGVDGQWTEEEKEVVQGVVGSYWQPASAM